jgi:hypothetical protein
MDEHQFKTLATGVLGTTTSIGAALYSLVPQLEMWARVGSVVIGLAVGLITLVKLIRDWNHRS